ncbi:tryptophan synthase subunit alpha [Buchnera aphidicola (Hormaphis cornu)]|nr:tryptophan synthase subunit alpha [Buchnera aphidicola (Hormaphis cornu)]
MNRYHKLFSHLAINKEGCFVPFVVLGDPSIQLSLNIIDVIINSGADAIELGIPFSDPMADGPIIQNANLRAFQSGITTIKCFQMLAAVRKKHPIIPIGLLVYANIIFSFGISKFYSICHECQIDSVLIADVPIEESISFIKSAKKYKISPIFICPPNANKALLKKIHFYSDSFIYLLSRSGVTGYKNKKHEKIKHLIHQLHEFQSVPLLQGFGISEPSEIKKIILSGVNGVICGSAIIQKIEKYNQDHSIMMRKLQSFVSILKQSTLQ